MKKLFFAALIALAGFTACGTKNVETARSNVIELYSNRSNRATGSRRR